ncbi:MAG: hypothetical protein AMXMBFR82_10090 [Candidatus Hydrogenedentota bacterium]
MVLHYGVAEGDLSVRPEGNFPVLPDTDNRGAVKGVHQISFMLASGAGMVRLKRLFEGIPVSTRRNALVFE